jgi:putative oxidoreductase
MTDINAVSAHSRANIARLWLRGLNWLEAIPYSVLALPLRFAVAWIFWSAGQVKLMNWERTLWFFREDYQVPVLSPELAANMATVIELTAPVLLVLGLFTRPTVLLLFGMTAVIQIFVYPSAWPTHLQWTAMMLVLFARGPGVLSLDYPLWRWVIEPRLRAARG